MARIKRMAAKSDILKFSDEDLEWFGLEGNHDDLAATGCSTAPNSS
jgi:fructokinase